MTYQLAIRQIITKTKILKILVFDFISRSCKDPTLPPEKRAISPLVDHARACSKCTDGQCTEILIFFHFNPSIKTF